MNAQHLDLRALRSFVHVVETGSVTEAARRVGRTQPAITLQIRRLEEQTGRHFFEPMARRPLLTQDGEVLLGYARAILRMHDELWTRMHTRPIEGRVVLGTPDLYAYLLPRLLTDFRAAHPGVEVDVHCALSRSLMTQLDAKEIDIALVTAMPGIRAGEFIRREPLVWVSGQDHAAYNDNPVPLALLPPGNIYRDAALEALDRIGRTWRLACISESISGLQAAIFSGFAVSVLTRSALVPGMRVIGPAESFPDLPEVDVEMHRSAGRTTAAAQRLADFVVASLVRDARPAAASLPATSGMI
jgi:DNA-binding transcriptional LysR family regulator